MNEKETLDKIAQTLRDAGWMVTPPSPDPTTASAIEHEMAETLRHRGWTVVWPLAMIRDGDGDIWYRQLDGRYVCGNRDSVGPDEPRYSLEWIAETYPPIKPVTG